MAASKLSPFLFSKRLPISHRLLQSLHFSSPLQIHDPAISSLKRNPNPSTLIDLLDADPDPISALHLFRWASRQKNFHPTPATYAHLISKLAFAGKSQEMDEFLNEMVKSQYPDAELSFRLLVESFCRNQRVEEALKVFETASWARVKLPISTCNELLGVLVGKRSNLDQVVFVYKEMVKAEVLPNVDTLNCLIKCLVDNGKMELALDQFDRMEKKKCKPESRTFEVLISGLCSGGRVDKAVTIWNQMLEIGCSRGHDFYMSVIPWFCRVHRLDEAIELFKLMKDDGVLPDSYVYGVLIEFLCEKFRLDDALKLFEEMHVSRLAPVTCMSVDIVNAYCKLAKFSEAVNFVEENDISDVEPYNALLQGLCDGDRFQEANNFLEKMREKGMSDAYSWNVLIRLLCKKGYVGKAFEILGRMIISSYLPNEATYSAIVTGFCKICSFDSALDWCWRGLGKNMSFDSESCCQLIKGLCHITKVEEAVEVFYCITTKGHGPNANALNVLIQGLCCRGKINEAIKLRSVAFYNGTASTPFTYETIVIGLLNLRKEKHVLPLLSQMLMEGCNLNSKTYHILICGLCVECTRLSALLFNQMVKDGLIPDPETVEKLVYNVSKCCRLHLIMRSLDKVIEEEGLKSPKLCNMIVSGLLKEGCKDEAGKLLDWMLEKGWVPDSNTHGLLIGNVDGNEAYEDSDEVSSILFEGLGDSR